MSQELMPPLRFRTTTLMAIWSYWYNFPSSGSRCSSSVSLAVWPIHQHISVLNLMPLFLLTFTNLLTFIVFTNVTIGIGAVIHISKANARLVSWGCTSVFMIIFFSKPPIQHPHHPCRIRSRECGVRRRQCRSSDLPRHVSPPDCPNRWHCRQEVSLYCR